MSSPTTQSSPRPPFSISAAVRNLLILGVLFFLARQFYLIYTTSATGNHHTKHKSDEYLVNYYFNIFQDLIFDGYLTTDSKTLTIGTQFHEYRAALKELGVWNKKSTKNNVYLPFKDDSFDIQFSSHTGLDSSVDPGRFASELSRTLKKEGYLVIHTESEDSYSLNSLLDLFDSFKLIQSKEITSYHWSVPDLREILLQKKNRVLRRKNLAGSCSVPAYKKELIRKLEPLIVDEPLKPWIDFKKNIKKMKYLSKMADISFKTRYVYIDVGARNYESSIGSWFKKLYPKQNKSFEIFAIEADKRFHQEYESKKKITLLPYAAWVRNESLFFEINRDPNNTYNEKIQGMGRIQSAQTSTNFIRDPNMIRGFDFANWVRSIFVEKDFVVMKMDVEGTEFDLIKRMVETGSICLIDEMFLECHYNRFQRCCNGERTTKFQKVYSECTELFTFLREKGVFVHQWW